MLLAASSSWMTYTQYRWSSLLCEAIAKNPVPPSERVPGLPQAVKREAAS
jgi:hypothetical protein